MNDILSLVRPDIRALKPYTSARSLTTEGAVFLDANESPWPLLENGSYQRVNRYPDPQPKKIVETASVLYGLDRRSILVSRGTDEGIEVLTRTVCEAGKDQVLICPPTYGVYETAARIQGCGVVNVPLVGSPDFKLDMKRMLRAVGDKSNRIKLIYICSPNNPTGTVFDSPEILEICRAAAGRALVVLDEAYLEFSGLPSLSPKIRKFPNLVVLRTLSKAWGLAGVRCGFVLADPALIAILQGVRAPYPMSRPSIQVIESVFTKEGQKKMLRSVADILAQKKRLVKAFSAMRGIETVFPSRANFVLIRTKAKEDILQTAQKAGIILRDRSVDEGLVNCIRVTAGSAEETDAVIACFRKALGGASQSELKKKTNTKK
jgi:histidinol-phosphate aminotransferase